MRSDEVRSPLNRCLCRFVNLRCCLRGTMLIKEYRICMPLTVEEVGELVPSLTPTPPVTGPSRPFTPPQGRRPKLRERRAGPPLSRVCLFAAGPLVNNSRELSGGHAGRSRTLSPSSSALFLTSSLLCARLRNSCPIFYA